MVSSGLVIGALRHVIRINLVITKYTMHFVVCE